MALIVADSDVLIDFLRGQGKGAERVAAELQSRALVTTSISAFELHSGVRSAKQRKSADAVLNAIPILPFGAQDASTAATIRKALDSTGQTIGMADIMIAAICLTNGCPLLTRNVKHFDRVEGLQVVTP
jgi:tRNA(fMet)-specific endonuclease VapC